MDFSSDESDYEMEEVSHSSDEDEELLSSSFESEEFFPPRNTLKIAP